MRIEFSNRIRSAPDVLARDVDGETVLLNLDSETYFGLDEVGTRMWTLVMSSESIQAAYEVLENEYEVDAERLRNDLSALIEEWVANGLAQIDVD